jgi:hypothetical protein
LAGYQFQKWGWHVLGVLNKKSVRLNVLSGSVLNSQWIRPVEVLSERPVAGVLV